MQRGQHQMSGFGERERRVQIVPAVAVGFIRDNQVFPSSDGAKVPIRLISNASNVEAEVRLAAPEGWRVFPESINVEFSRIGQEQTVEFELTPPADVSGGELKASAIVDGKTIAVGMRTIEYEHIPIQMVYPPAEMRVERVDVKLLSPDPTDQ